MFDRVEDRPDDLLAPVVPEVLRHAEADHVAVHVSERVPAAVRSTEERFPDQGVYNPLVRRTHRAATSSQIATGLRGWHEVVTYRVTCERAIPVDLRQALTGPLTAVTFADVTWLEMINRRRN